MTEVRGAIDRIDASVLPAGAIDYRALTWWGNVLLLAIESTMFVLLVAVYLYLRQDSHWWPPPHVTRLPRLTDARPSLGFATANAVLMLLSIVPFWRSDHAALRLDRQAIVRWSGVGVLMALGIIALRALEFGALHFRWDDNAYGSITWTILGLHLIHLLICAVENGLTWFWVARKGLDQKHALDVRCSVIYWFWVVAVGVGLYVVVFLGPRLG
jgi:cytochrome c oxidase subunit 3